MIYSIISDMQTRSQTKANMNLFMEEVNKDFERKTRLIRRSSIVSLPKNNNKLPQNIFTTIRTRSQTRAIDMYNSIKQKNAYSVDIDFDGASRAWRKNKVSIGNGCYEYK